MTSEGHEEHLLPPLFYFMIWIILVCLTAVTLGVTYLDMGRWAIFTAILVATFKASLVGLYFMHIKYEQRLIPIILLVTLGSFAVFFILVFTDYPFR